MSHRSLRAACAFVAIVVVVVASSVVTGAAQTAPSQPSGLDHFVCYNVVPETTPPPFVLTPPLVLLTDHFGSAPAPLYQLSQLCAPVMKRLPSGQEFPPTNPEANLVCWEIQRSQPVVDKRVIVTNQFGTGRLHVTTVRRLCLPSWGGPLDRPLPTAEAPAGLDHFECYNVDPAPPGSFQLTPTVVQLVNQFGEHQTPVRQALELYNPARKDVTGRPPTEIANALAHLLCFEIDAKPLSFRMQAKNQFGRGFVSTAPAARVTDKLCVPSYSAESPEPQVPELSSVPLLPVSAAVVGAMFVLVRQRCRRRSSRSSSGSVNDRVLSRH